MTTWQHPPRRPDPVRPPFGMAAIIILSAMALAWVTLSVLPKAVGQAAYDLNCHVGPAE